MERSMINVVKHNEKLMHNHQTKLNKMKAQQVAPKTHRCPTRWKEKSKLCETNDKHTNHWNISLNENEITGRKSALNGFLEQAHAVWDPEKQKMMEFRDLIQDPKTKDTWTTSMANELGRLAQGIRDTKGSNCMKFMQQNQVPKGRKVTCA